jgi:hypothetical protein
VDRTTEGIRIRAPPLRQTSSVTIQLRRTVVAALVLAIFTTPHEAAPTLASVTAPAPVRPTAKPAHKPRPAASATPGALTPAADRAPTADLVCPQDFSSPWGAEARAEFGFTADPGSNAIAAFDLTYGDGKSYGVTTLAHAEGSLFWHRYQEPGSYEPTLTLTDEAGLLARDSCTFTCSWTGSAPAPTAGSSSGWSGCEYNGIAMWGRVKLVENFPGN